MPLTDEYAIDISSGASGASGLIAWDEDAAESVRDGVPQARRTILTHWEDRWLVINALGVGDDGFGAEYPDNTILRARNMDVVGEDGETGLTMGVNGMVAHKYARIVIEYLLPEENILVEGNEIGGETIDFSNEPLPYSATEVTWKWDGGADISAQTIPSRTERVVQFAKWARGFDALPIDTILACIDRVNSAEIFGAANETVLFLGGQSARRILTTGAAKWDVSWKFKWKASGFNHGFNPATGTFQRIVAKNNTSRGQYLLADLNDLFP